MNHSAEKDALSKYLSLKHIAVASTIGASNEIPESGAGILPASLFFLTSPYPRSKRRGISSVARASRLRVGCFNWVPCSFEFQLSRNNIRCV
jgi:hypothetical protein